MLFGIARHTELIWYRMGEGLSIVVVGTIFLRVWGLPGLALVTAVTLLLTSLVLIPRDLCRILELPLRQYLNEGCLRPCIPAVPFAATLLAARFLVVIDTRLALIMSLLLGGLTYLLTLSLLMFRHSPPSWLSLGDLEPVRERFAGLARSGPRAQ